LKPQPVGQKGEEEEEEDEIEFFGTQRRMGMSLCVQRQNVYILYILKSERIGVALRGSFRNIAAFVNMQNAMYLSPKPVIQATGSNRHLSIYSTRNRIPETALFCVFASFFFSLSLEFSADLGL